MINMASWFKPKRVEVIRRDVCRLTAQEWRTTAPLVKVANKFLSDPDFRMMLDVLSKEHPAGIVLQDHATIESRAIWQARCEGYTMAIANLESLGEFSKAVRTLEATFEPPEQESTPTNEL